MIRRAEHSAEKRFTIISRALAQNKSLSFQARGFLLFVLSKPAKWEATDANLQKDGGIGKKALASILTELKEAGYLRRTQERKRDGTIRYITEVFEEPLPVEACTVPPKGTTVTVTPFPPTDNGTTDNNSTCARAGSSVDLTDLRDRRTPSKKSYKTPEPEAVLDPPYHSNQFLGVLERFERHRAEIKCKLTPTSRDELYRTLAQCDDEETATEALLASIRNGWKGVFPERVYPFTRKEEPQQPRRQTIAERLGVTEEEAYRIAANTGYQRNGARAN